MQAQTGIYRSRLVPFFQCNQVSRRAAWGRQCCWVSAWRNTAHPLLPRCPRATMPGCLARACRTQHALVGVQCGEGLKHHSPVRQGTPLEVWQRLRYMPEAFVNTAQPQSTSFFPPTFPSRGKRHIATPFYPEKSASPHVLAPCYCRLWQKCKIQGNFFVVRSQSYPKLITRAGYVLPFRAVSPSEACKATYIWQGSDNCFHSPQKLVIVKIKNKRCWGAHSPPEQSQQQKTKTKTKRFSNSLPDRNVFNMKPLAYGTSHFVSQRGAPAVSLQRYTTPLTFPCWWSSWAESFSSQHRNIWVQLLSCVSFHQRAELTSEQPKGWVLFKSHQNDGVRSQTSSQFKSRSSGT